MKFFSFSQFRNAKWAPSTGIFHFGGVAVPISCAVQPALKKAESQQNTRNTPPLAHELCSESRTAVARPAHAALATHGHTDCRTSSFTRLHAMPGAACLFLSPLSKFNCSRFSFHSSSSCLQKAHSHKVPAYCALGAATHLLSPIVLNLRQPSIRHPE